MLAAGTAAVAATGASVAHWPREWRMVLGSSKYAVSNDGRVRNVETGRLLSPWNADGYMRVALSDDAGRPVQRYVHDLVVEAFDGPCPTGKQCRHLNGARADNRWPTNLVWGTPVENCADRALHGRSRLVDMAGRVFGRLRVVARSPISGRQARWLCECACGVSKTVRGDVLRGGSVSSCGRCKP